MVSDIITITVNLNCCMWKKYCNKCSFIHTSSMYVRSSVLGIWETSRFCWIHCSVINAYRIAFIIGSPGPPFNRIYPVNFPQISYIFVSSFSPSWMNTLFPSGPYNIASPIALVSNLNNKGTLVTIVDRLFNFKKSYQNNFLFNHRFWNWCKIYMTKLTVIQVSYRHFP